MNVAEARRVLEYAIRESGVDAHAELEHLISVIARVRKLADGATWCQECAVGREILHAVDTPPLTYLVVMQEPEGSYRCNAEGCDWISDPYEHAANVHGVEDAGNVNVVHPDDH